MLPRPEASRLALELRYARSLEGAQIAERSLQEMQGIGEVTRERGERWLEAMRTIFPDVNKGDRITGLQIPGEAARFWVNGQSRGELRDAEFTRLFFGIWLSPRSSQPNRTASSPSETDIVRAGLLACGLGHGRRRGGSRRA